MGEKPEKYTWYEFLVKPVIRVLKNTIDAIKKDYLGYWFCGYCCKLHSPRIKKYRKRRPFFTTLYVCSLYKEDKHD